MKSMRRACRTAAAHQAPALFLFPSLRRASSVNAEGNEASATAAAAAPDVEPLQFTTTTTADGTTKSSSFSSSSFIQHMDARDAAKVEEGLFRTMHPKVRLRAETQQRRPLPWQQQHVGQGYPRHTTTAMLKAEREQSDGQNRATASLPTEGDKVHRVVAAPGAAEMNTMVLTESVEDSQMEPSCSTAVAAVSAELLYYELQRKNEQNRAGLNEVQAFIEEVQSQVEASRQKRNAKLAYPEHPDSLVPAFRRIKRHQKQEVVVPDDLAFPKFQALDAHVPDRPMRMHPWVKNTPIGDRIVHGDGQINMGGTGEVGFDARPLHEQLPSYYRGLQHKSILQARLPQKNGKARQDMVIRHSFALTGRGVFATRDIKKGDTIMIVQSTTQSVGVKGELQRLQDMTVELLTSCRDGDEESLAFLHDWILTGQPSSLLEYWPIARTEKVIEIIGGPQVLDALELHPIHIARIAAIMDLNSFLVESYYAERKGMAYFPEAGFLNHSCDPNATYDIIPEHTFLDSDYYVDEAAERETEAAGAVTVESVTAAASANVTEVRSERESPASGVEADEACTKIESYETPAAADSDVTDKEEGNKAHTTPRREETDGEHATADASSSEHISSSVTPPPPCSAYASSATARKSGEEGQQATIEKEEEKNTAALAERDGIDFAPPTRNVASFADPYISHYPDLTEASAPTYLFCCRAVKDIAAGEEVLISYVPASWNFDNRQYVLHDRYAFWCKCPKCSPTLDTTYAKVPRFVVGLIVFCVLLQLLVFRQRATLHTAHYEEEDRQSMSLEERRERGINVEAAASPKDKKIARRDARRGLFEIMAEKQYKSVFEGDSGYETYEQEGIRLQEEKKKAQLRGKPL